MQRLNRSSGGQSMVEFSMTIGLLMLLIVMTAQVAVYLQHRNSLELAAREGAFEAALAGHTQRDGELAAQRMWGTVEPGSGPITVSVSRSGRLVLVTASASSPAFVPMPSSFSVLSARAVHTVETFEPGSAP